MNTIAFTGPRPKSLCGYDIDAYKYFVDNLSAWLKNTYCKEPIRFITGGAQGFDQLAFWAANRAKFENPSIPVKNEIYVPFRGQETAWEKDGLFGQNNYKDMLKAADNVLYLKNELQDKHLIVKALFERNHTMIDNADALIALYPDDSWRTKKNSGTAEAMRYALKCKKPIQQITFTTEKMLKPTNIITIR